VRPVRTCLFVYTRERYRWHFGAHQGILMCHVKVDNMEEADKWEAAALPRQGDERGVWVTRMLEVLDARLEGRADVSERED
jgi:hypothetical protein